MADGWVRRGWLWLIFWGTALALVGACGGRFESGARPGADSGGTASSTGQHGEADTPPKPTTRPPDQEVGGAVSEPGQPSEPTSPLRPFGQCGDAPYCGGCSQNLYTIVCSRAAVPEPWS